MSSLHFFFFIYVFSSFHLVNFLVTYIKKKIFSWSWWFFSSASYLESIIKKNPSNYKFKIGSWASKDNVFYEIHHWNAYMRQLLLSKKRVDQHDYIYWWICFFFAVEQQRKERKDDRVRIFKGAKESKTTRLQHYKIFFEHKIS